MTLHIEDSNFPLNHTQQKEGEQKEESFELEPICMKNDSLGTDTDKERASSNIKAAEWSRNFL